MKNWFVRKITSVFVPLNRPHLAILWRLNDLSARYSLNVGFVRYIIGIGIMRDLRASIVWIGCGRTSEKPQHNEYLINYICLCITSRLCLSEIFQFWYVTVLRKTKKPARNSDRLPATIKFFSGFSESFVHIDTVGWIFRFFRSSAESGPNSNHPLFSDQVAAKMAAEATTAATAAAAADYSSHYSRYANSSDSEQETVTAAAASSSPQLKAAMTMMTPKRNKRKNFKPRCSTTNVSASSVEETAALQSEPAAVAEYSNNNNLKNVRRRKTMSTRKLVLDSR